MIYSLSKLLVYSVPALYLQILHLSLYSADLHPRFPTLGQPPSAAGNPGQELPQGIVELPQLQQSVLQLVLAPEAVRVELRPGRAQLVHLVLDVGPVLWGTVLLQLLAFGERLADLVLQVSQRRFKLLRGGRKAPLKLLRSGMFVGTRHLRGCPLLEVDV